MASYVDYEFYKDLYGENAMPEPDFKRLSWEAQKHVDDRTFGKLKFAFPTNEDDAEAVKRCVCKLIEIASAIESANKRINDAQGYVSDDNGIHGKVISSVSSGSESISYTAKSESGSTLIDAVLSDKAEQDKLYADTVKEYLEGVPDANGVNLLYAGIPYPGKRGN